MEKAELREKLFNMHFDDSDSVLASDFVDRLSSITDTWKKLHKICEGNIRHFDRFSYLDSFKLLEHNGRKYLILGLRLLKYVVVDLERMECLSKEEVCRVFDEEFFQSNFDVLCTSSGMDIYSIINFPDVSGLVDFYVENSEILSLPDRVDCRYEIGDAWTYFHIDLVNGCAQLGFQTPDQYLYEQLFLNFDLSPSAMQDAHEKIGIDKMKEMFSRIQDIRIPKQFISKELYDYYLAQGTKGSKGQKVKSTDLDS